MEENETPSRHSHCEKCHNQHCKLPVDISNSCVFLSCRLNCGANFHLCKEDEHRLLCPKETVPCINSGYGCPMTMTRQKLAKHLEVCPASIVTCTQEWNRWPVLEKDTTFYKNASQDSRYATQLDLGMALRDQKLLFSSIKMKKLFPESIEQSTSHDLKDEAVGGADLESEGNKSFTQDVGCTGSKTSDVELTQEERLALARSKDVASLDNYDTWERMFTKEMEGCKQTVKNFDDKTGTKNKTKVDAKVTTRSEPHEVDISRTGLAPWQEGVLDRLSKEVNVAEYNMYLVHNGCMLINFGQLAACTPKEKDFVYGNLEPIEVQTVRSFNVPTSYRAKRCHLKDPSQTIKKVHQNVDTLDLEIAIDQIPTTNVVEASLLCSLERELKGHEICETGGTDGLYVDFGTQTYKFHEAPFKSEASLADVVQDQPQHIHMQMQTECVTRRHNKSCSAFSYLCGHTLRRDEFHWHFRNVHGDIQSCLNGWFLQRCPLAYLGCTFGQRQFRPSRFQATVTYDPDLSTFALRPDVPASLYDGVKTSISERRRARNLDSLSKLPVEILQHIVAFLDSLSLSCLAQVSQLMRDVCSAVLQKKGMVSLKWEKKTYSHGGFTWRARKKAWEFSRLFSPVDGWTFEDIPPMTEHLKVCPFYEKQIQTEPVALPSMIELQGGSEEFQNLVRTLINPS